MVDSIIHALTHDVLVYMLMGRTERGRRWERRVWYGVVYIVTQMHEMKKKEAKQTDQEINRQRRVIDRASRRW
jgi:hypothetical protein